MRGGDAVEVFVFGLAGGGGGARGDRDAGVHVAGDCCEDGFGLGWGGCLLSCYDGGGVGAFEVVFVVSFGEKGRCC